MKILKIIVLIVAILFFFFLGVYHQTTKIYYGEDCAGYNWDFSDSKVVCEECDYEFNPNLIVDGFDFKQRYLDGCKLSYVNEVVIMEVAP